ncbi:MAG: LptF/LptG family permease [bacterium]
MKIIDKYMLKQYLIPFGYCFWAFSLLYIVLDLFDRLGDFMDVKAPITDILLYYGLFLFKVNGFVPFIVVVLPIALLLATLYTLTMFANHNELTAMCASGVSVRRLMLPLMGVGLCASLFGAVIQETVGPNATRWISDYTKQTLKRSPDSSFKVREFVYHTGPSHRQWFIKEFDQRTPTRVMGVKVSQQRSDGSLETELTAEHAEWMDGTWWFYGLQRQEFDARGDPAGAPSAIADRPMEMPDYPERPDDFINEMKDSDYLSTLEMIRIVRNRPSVSAKWVAWRLTDIHARVAMPWSCLVLILLGLPATAGGARRPAMRSVVFGLCALFGFYFLVQCGMILGKQEIIWPWLAGWLPNITFLIIGGWLTWRLK